MFDNKLAVGYVLLQMPKHAWFCIWFLLAGCATFDPETRYQEVLRPRQPTVTEVRERIGVSLEEFISSKKSRSIFDADLASHGVLAILLKTENKSEASYTVDDKETKAFLANRILPRLRGLDAANHAATRDYASKAAGWTLATGPLALLFWPLTVSVSGIHTGEVNRKIEQHFETLAFGKAMVKPGQTAVGFLYFKLPEDLKETEQIVVEIIAHETENNKQIPFNFTIPNLGMLRKN